MLKVVRAERGQGSGRGAPRVPGQAFHGGGRAGGRGHRGQAGARLAGLASPWAGRKGGSLPGLSQKANHDSRGSLGGQLRGGGSDGPGNPDPGVCEGRMDFGCCMCAPVPWALVPWALVPWQGRGRGWRVGEATGSWSQSHGAASLLLGRFCPLSHPLAFQLGPHSRAHPPTICCSFCQCWGRSVASVSL